MKTTQKELRVRLVINFICILGLLLPWITYSQTWSSEQLNEVLYQQRPSKGFAKEIRDALNNKNCETSSVHFLIYYHVKGKKLVDFEFIGTSNERLTNVFSERIELGASHVEWKNFGRPRKKTLLQPIIILSMNCMKNEQEQRAYFKSVWDSYSLASGFKDAKLISPFGMLLHEIVE